MSNRQEVSFPLAYYIDWHVLKRLSERWQGTNPADYKYFIARCDYRVQRLRQGQAVLAFYSDGSGPIVGRIKSKYPRNPLAQVWVETYYAKSGSGEAIRERIAAFDANHVLPITGYQGVADIGPILAAVDGRRA
ncbi:hypothetical protein [Hyphomicrobium sp. 2TAF46]|uniref:hypothetical protein n=1 Tax=Hyphomicrobium sp. 2TAF46 TaxID=3233019 RepID=UPI003F913CC5